MVLCLVNIPLGTLYPSATTSSDESLPINIVSGYNLNVSLIHIVV